MDRRRFLLTSLAGALAAPLAADAQRPVKAPRIGLLLGGSQGSMQPLVEEFRQGLRELGYTEGQRVLIEYRFADGQMDRLPELAADLVRLKVELIVTSGSTTALAAQKVTDAIPIVMVNTGDPVRLGLVASLSRPGRNVTGLASYLPELAGKHLEVLKELVPAFKRVAVVWTPSNPLHAGGLKDLEAPARTLALEIVPLKVSSPDHLEGVFQTATAERAGAVWVFGDSMFLLHRDQIATLALNRRLPTLFNYRQHVDVGGLISYGPSAPVMYHRAAVFVDKILKGAKPADLPVEQPTKFEMVINLKTAKALGLTIPPSVLARADQVIE